MGTPRGWSNEMTWANCSGFYDRQKRCVVVAGEFLQDGEWVQENRVTWVVLHEIGHAFDYLTRPSPSWPLRSVYLACRKRVKGDMSLASLAYYVQADWAIGFKEAFADAFAYVLLRRASLVQTMPDWREFYRGFKPLVSELEGRL